MIVAKSILIALMVFATSTFNYIVINHFVVLNWFYGYKKTFRSSFVLGSAIYASFILSFISNPNATITPLLASVD